jgi:hypothetical protein
VLPGWGIGALPSGPMRSWGARSFTRLLRACTSRAAPGGDAGPKASDASRCAFPPEEASGRGRSRSGMGIGACGCGGRRALGNVPSSPPRPNQPITGSGFIVTLDP